MTTSCAAPCVAGHDAVLGGAPAGAAASLPVESRWLWMKKPPPMMTTMPEHHRPDHQGAAQPLLALLLRPQGSSPGGALSGLVALRHRGPSPVLRATSPSGSGRSRCPGTTGCAVVRRATARPAAGPTSRAISQGYFDEAPASWPPPPKQPQSIWSPRAQAEAMPMMKATNSRADTTAMARVSRPSTRHSADDDLDDRQQLADGRHDRLGQQVVGADGPHAVRRVGQLEQRRRRSRRRP